MRWNRVPGSSLIALMTTKAYVILELLNRAIHLGKWRSGDKSGKGIFFTLYLFVSIWIFLDF